MDIKDSILELVGDTPMVRLHRCNPNPAVDLVAKLEWYNPFGSVKERIALRMIQRAIADGRLTKDKTILESSSGNTGIGLAMVGAVLGYKVAITMSEGTSIERRQVLRALGAEIILTSKEGGSDEAWDKADELYARHPDKYVRLHQYQSPDNAATHEEITAEEIWAQTEGQLDAVVATLGTTGTVVGLSRRLKRKNPAIRIISVEPQPGKHKQQGIRNVDYSRTPMIWDPSCVDERLYVSDEEAYRAARELMRHEGLFGGISCGSALAAAQRVVRAMSRGRVVAIFPDHGYKYLSTDLYPA
ncbi:MAG TPA: PLP-dependent cysteine synthase family protein [bacterium]|nr:PLP-dependent cysteine synthase family protein [bacterium]